jgi:GNAT superfamily N-acetyltransferase
VESGDVLSPSAADASVRPARAADADAIGAVQARCWRSAYRGVVPATVLDQVSAAAIAPHWHAAITAPPSPHHHVLVACAGSTVVGFAAAGPSGDADAADADAELLALEIDPSHQRAGHASRLLAAAVDLLRTDGSTVLRVWTPDADTARHAFLVSAGLRADGAQRLLRGDDDSEAGQTRLSAALPG